MLNDFEFPTPEEIEEEIRRRESVQTSKVESECKIFSLETVNDTMTVARELPDAKPLWKNLWYEGEVCCLFADTNLGKSIYAVEIGEHIARQEPVVYFDFELTPKQFAVRYRDELTGSDHRFPDNFYRVRVNIEEYAAHLCDRDLDDVIIGEIESLVEASGARTFILDNLTWICNGSEKGDAAGDFMRKLMSLKHGYGWSILVVAHTPKLPMGEPIGSNSLAGSKRLINFFDSAFAIGQSQVDPSLRYIKQIKARNGEFTYGADNVLLASIVKKGDFIGFEEQGTAPEDQHLRRPNEKSDRNAEILRLWAEGVTQVDIARRMGITRQRVSKIISDNG